MWVRIFFDSLLGRFCAFFKVFVYLVLCLGRIRDKYCVGVRSFGSLERRGFRRGRTGRGFRVFGVFFR